MRPSAIGPRSAEAVPQNCAPTRMKCALRRCRGGRLSPLRFFPAASIFSRRCQTRTGDDEAARILHRLQLLCRPVAGKGRRVGKLGTMKFRLGPPLRIELAASDNTYKENCL